MRHMHTKTRLPCHTEKPALLALHGLLFHVHNRLPHMRRATCFAATTTLLFLLMQQHTATVAALCALPTDVN